MEEAILTAILAISAKYNMDPELVQAIIKVESNYNRMAVGKSHHEVGLMQLRPDYFKRATFDIKGNIEQGVAYLAEIRPKCIKKYGKDAWFICYNTGPNNVKLNSPKNFPYYKKVLHAKTENQRAGSRVCSTPRKSKDDFAQVHAKVDGRQGRSGVWRICSRREYYIYFEGPKQRGSTPHILARTEARP